MSETTPDTATAATPAAAAHAAPPAPDPASATVLGSPAGTATADSTPAAPAAAGHEDPKTLEDYQAIVRKLRDENASWRTKLRDAEPILKAHAEAEEAAKTELQRATERAAAAEKAAAEREAQLNVLRAAAKHGIPEEDHDLLGSGTPEELDARAARLAARYASSTALTPPPSDRPVEGLRPGASPTPPAQPDISYPAAWKP